MHTTIFDVSSIDALPTEELRTKLLVAIEYAQQHGTTAGEAAASWFEAPDDLFDCVDLLREYTEGDPEWHDHLPRVSLSGEWADDPDPDSVASDAASDADVDLDELDDELRSEWVDALSDAWLQAAESAVERTVLRTLGDQVQYLCNEQLR